MLNLASKQMKKMESVYNKLSNTLKIAVMLGLLAAIFLVWVVFVSVILPGSSKNAVSIDAQKKELQLMKNELTTLQNKIKTENNPALTKEEQTNEAELKKVNDQIALMRKQMVSPDQLLLGLKKLLHQDHGLELISLHNLPDEPAGETKLPLMFRSPFEMSVQGNFYQMLSYFQQVETLHPYVFVDEMTYKTLTYPDAEITLKFHIFTSKKGESIGASK